MSTPIAARTASCGCAYDETGQCTKWCSVHEEERPEPAGKTPKATPAETWTPMPCPCGQTGCQSWMVLPVAMLQGLGMDKRRAHMVAAAPQALALLADIARHTALPVPLAQRVRELLAFIPER